MSDNTNCILAALERLEQGQGLLLTDLVIMRTDLMARMDRLQHCIDVIELALIDWKPK